MLHWKIPSRTNKRSNSDPQLKNSPPCLAGVGYCLLPISYSKRGQNG
jgi:hypothetical protein